MKAKPALLWVHKIYPLMTGTCFIHITKLKSQKILAREILFSIVHMKNLLENQFPFKLQRNKKEKKINSKGSTFHAECLSS